MLRTGQRRRARAGCYQRDLNDLCLVKKQHSVPLHKLPLIFHCSANTWLSNHTQEGTILFFYMSNFFLSPSRGDRFYQRGYYEGGEIRCLISLLRLASSSVKEGLLVQPCNCPSSTSIIVSVAIATVAASIKLTLITLIWCTRA